MADGREEREDQKLRRQKEEPPRDKEDWLDRQPPDEWQPERPDS